MRGKPMAALAAACLLLAAGTVLAAGPGSVLDAAQTGPYHQDLNQDGIADWVQNQQRWQEVTQGQYGAWADLNGDGIHDWWQNQGQWTQTTGGAFGDWADLNGDGICDNFEVRPQDGTGMGYKGGR